MSLTPFPPDPPSPAGWLAGSTLLDQIEEILKTASQPASKVERSLPGEGGCRFAENRQLCQRFEPAHLTDSDHVLLVLRFLEVRGVRRALGMARRYGVMACNAVSWMVESWETQGIDWTEGLDSPGAWVHSQIRVFHENPGLYIAMHRSGDAWPENRTPKTSDKAQNNREKYVEEFRRRRGYLPGEKPADNREKYIEEFRQLRGHLPGEPPPTGT